MTGEFFTVATYRSGGGFVVWFFLAACVREITVEFIPCERRKWLLLGENRKTQPAVVGCR
jgi:hypothetical protein